MDEWDGFTDREQFSSYPGLRLVSGADAQPNWIARQPRPSSRVRVPSLTELGLRVSVVIAALNEEQNLPYVFARLPDGLHEVIVVDGHSTDGRSPRRVSCGRECAS